MILFCLVSSHLALSATKFLSQRSYSISKFKFILLYLCSLCLNLGLIIHSTNFNHREDQDGNKGWVSVVKDKRIKNNTDSDFHFKSSYLSCSWPVIKLRCFGFILFLHISLFGETNCTNCSLCHWKFNLGNYNGKYYFRFR